jgi:hypothetical protein
LRRHVCQSHRIIKWVIKNETLYTIGINVYSYCLFLLICVIGLYCPFDMLNFLSDKPQWDLDEFEEFYTVFTHEFYKNNNNADSVDQFSDPFSAFNDAVPDSVT